jgi:hypothetical protein
MCCDTMLVWIEIMIGIVTRCYENNDHQLHQP